MIITNKNAVVQALANIRLEGFSVPCEVMGLLNKALAGRETDTVDILTTIKVKHEKR